MSGRADRTIISEWWWTIDRAMLASMVALLIGGVVLSLAASPPVAERLNLETYHFFKRQAFYMGPSLLVMIGVSFLTPRQVRRVAFFGFMIAFVLMIATITRLACSICPLTFCPVGRAGRAIWGKVA